MKDGYFLWPDLHLGLDPSHCHGVVMFLWRGTHERHGTMECTIMDGDVIRYGTSIQVNRRLLASVVQYQADVARYEEQLALFKEGLRRTEPREPARPTGIQA